ncbi:hypothetical protein GWN26_02790, partial [Candidatus Saccharibacteria bacterium]|nr:hypothetical protein [Candidatus Saccharibacteria bacterium]NIW78400.1 hypothetical protein [Calditrichia bacterium]
MDAAPQTAEVALLYHPQNQIFAWISTKNEKNATDSLLGYHRALYEHNFRIDFVHPSEFEMNILKNYKVLVIPFPYWLGEKICSKLDQWVEAGGVLIGEAYFAGWNVEQGHHEKIVPGYGLHEVFQTRQGLVEPVIGENTEIELLENLPYLHKGSVVKGSLVRESFFIEGARVLACHSNGQPAVTCAEYGKGKAILIGSYIGLPFHRQKCNQNANLIAGLVEYAMPISRPRVEGNAKVRIDILTGLKNQTMIIVQNLENRSAEITAHLPFKINNKLKEQFSSEILSSIELSAGKGSKISMQLTAKEVKVYC